MISRHSINSGFELPVRFTYCEPVWLPVYYIALHTGAIFSVIVAELPIIARVLLIIFIISSFILWGYDRFVRKVHKHGLEIILNNQNEWTIKETGLQPVTAILISARILHESLIYIKLKSTCGKVYQLWLSRSSIDKDNMRRLRVRLLLPAVSGYENSNPS